MNAGFFPVYPLSRDGNACKQTAIVGAIHSVVFGGPLFSLPRADLNGNKPRIEDTEAVRRSTADAAGVACHGFVELKGRAPTTRLPRLILPAMSRCRA